MISKFFIDRPIFAIVISLIISIFGLLSMATLPVAKYPQVTPPQVRVSATYIGANAEVVGTTVASVIERQLVGVDNLVNMESSTNDNGSYSMTVQFKSGSDGDMDTVNTQNRVSQVQSTLPSEVTQTGVTVQKSTSSMAMVFALVSPNGSYDATFMKNYATQYFMDELKSVPGIGDVQEFGSDYAMRIWLNPMKMNILKITPTDVISAISTQNKQAAVGTMAPSRRRTTRLTSIPCVPTAACRRRNSSRTSSSAPIPTVPWSASATLPMSAWDPRIIPLPVTSTAARLPVS